jgi:hypothetical protein
MGSGWRVIISDDPVTEAVFGSATKPCVAVIVPCIEIGSEAFAAAAKMLASGSKVVRFPVLFGKSGSIHKFSPLVVGCFAFAPGWLEGGDESSLDDQFAARCCVSGKTTCFRTVIREDGRPVFSTPMAADDIQLSGSMPERLSKPSVEEHKVAQFIDTAPLIDMALIAHEERFGAWRFVEERPIPGNQKDFEVLMRSLRCHWIAIHWGDGSWTWPTAARTAFAHMDKDMLVFPGLTLVHPGSFRRLPPVIPDVKAWTAKARDHAHCATFDADGNCISTVNRPSCPQKSGRGLKVAVMSMCGVTSFEDRYGIGGEHQVVHWLREGFLRHPDVAICDAYDTQNVGLAADGFYDLILSNSCWHNCPRTAKGGTSIFWHFNTNANRGNELTVTAMNYNVIWTNSEKSLAEFTRSGREAVLKHLNASSLHHGLYPWHSELFRHDACYVGGYQTEYKGKDLIDLYIKPPMSMDIDFAIYGNRKWRHEVQLAALETDRFFKPEHVDPSFDPFYKGLLHPDDFWILASNCKVWVNFNAADQRPLGMVNDRPIWSMGCGAFVITDDTPEQRALYRDTCDYSQGGVDLVRRIERWLTDEDERNKRRMAAMENIKKLKLFTDDTVAMSIETHLGRKRK